MCSQTLRYRVERLAQMLNPCYLALDHYVQSKNWRNVDETPWSFLDKTDKKRWVWSVSSYDVVYYHFDPNRSDEAELGIHLNKKLSYPIDIRFMVEERHSIVFRTDER